MTRKHRKKESLNLSTPRYQAVFPFSKDDGSGGITFVHRSVCDYFVAVKIYEDYFAQFTAKYFITNSPESDKAIKDVMTSIIEAFRYKRFDRDSEIFSYLNHMQQPAFTGSYEDDNSEFCFDLFAKTFSNGMQQHFYSDFKVPEFENAYKAIQTEILPLNAQINLAFCSFTRFLSCREESFNYSKLVAQCEEITEFFHTRNAHLCLKKWNLSGVKWLFPCLRGADLSGADLTGATFSSAILSGAKMSGTVMRNTVLPSAMMDGADLTNAVMNGAKLQRANLFKATLIGANMTDVTWFETNMSETNLINATLSGKKLDSVCFRKAKYCRVPGYETKFPDGFDPVAHDMIEVDEQGNVLK